MLLCCQTNKLFAINRGQRGAHEESDWNSLTVVGKLLSFLSVRALYRLTLHVPIITWLGSRSKICKLGKEIGPKVNDRGPFIPVYFCDLQPQSLLET